MPSRAASAAPNDEQLMRAVQADDDHAFELLYDRYKDSAWQVARLLCRPGDRVDRVVRDAFIGAWRERARYRPDRETAHEWTMRLLYRAAQPDNPCEPPDSPPAGETTGSSGSDAAGGRRTDARPLVSLVDDLPEPQKEIIALAFYGRLTHVQIAELLALSPGTVKGRMRLGLHKLLGASGPPPAHEREPPFDNRQH